MTSAEAQALHTVLADDLDDAARILRDFLPASCGRCSEGRKEITP